MFSNPNPMFQKSPVPSPQSPIPYTIGTRYEKSLHRDLKFSYAGLRGKTEVAVDGFVADGINARGEFIEIQTGSFSPLKKKIQKLSAQGRVRIVYPVIVTKYLEVYNTRSKLQYRRKSPRKGNPWDLFNALVYASDLPLIPGLVIELALVDALECRVQDGKGSWRREGLSIQDRRMIALHERICLEKPSDYLRFIPFEKNGKFTSSMLGKKAGIRITLARKTLYVLTKMGVVQRIGKQGNSYVYKRARKIPQ